MIDTEGLLEQLRTGVHRDVARRRRRRFVFAVAAFATAVVAGVGIAGTVGDWWTGGEPAVQPGEVTERMGESSVGTIQPDLSKKATVARTDDAALVAVQTKSGGFCMAVFVQGRDDGTSCDSTPVQGDGTGSAYKTRAQDDHWVAYGRITDAGAAVLDLSGAGLPAHVPIERGGFFLLDIPRADWKALDGKHGDVTILGGDGSTIRRACIYVGNAPGTASPGGGALGEPGGCADMAPIVPDPMLADARQLVTLKLAHPHGTFRTGDTIGSWSAPNRPRGVCTFLGPANVSPKPRGALTCTESSIPDAIEFRESSNLLSGFTPPNVVRVELSGSHGSLPIAFATAAFLAELPPGGGPYRIVAYDAKGREVASRRLP